MPSQAQREYIRHGGNRYQSTIDTTRSSDRGQFTHTSIVDFNRATKLTKGGRDTGDMMIGFPLRHATTLSQRAARPWLLSSNRIDRHAVRESRRLSSQSKDSPQEAMDKAQALHAELKEVRLVFTCQLPLHHLLC